MRISIERFKESQDAVRKYAVDLKNAQKKLDLAVDIILSLKEYMSTVTVLSIPKKIDKQINALTKGGYRG